MRQLLNAFNLFLDGEIEVKLIPSDFDGEFTEHTDCPVARALRRELGGDNILVYLDDCDIDGISLRMEFFGAGECGRIQEKPRNERYLIKRIWIQ